MVFYGTVLRFITRLNSFYEALVCVYYVFSGMKKPVELQSKLADELQCSNSQSMSSMMLTIVFTFKEFKL